MSAQLLICKICSFDFIFTDGSCDLHGSMAHSLSRPVILIVVTAWQSFQTVTFTCIEVILNCAYLNKKCDNA